MERAEVERGLVVGVVAQPQAVEDRGHALGTLRQRQVAVADCAVHLARRAVNLQHLVQVADRVREALEAQGRYTVDQGGRKVPMEHDARGRLYCGRPVGHGDALPARRDAAALWRRLCAVPLQGARARGFWGAGLGPRGLSRSRAPSRAQRELRALLPEGVTQWQRAFGSATMMAGGAAHGDRDGGDGGNGGGGGDGGDGGGDGGGGDSGGATGDEPAGGDGAEVDT